MSGYFTRERFGRPQFLAGMMLVVFLGQAMWLVGREGRHVSEPYAGDEFRAVAGSYQWHGKGIAGTPSNPLKVLPVADSDAEGFDTEHSPLIALVSAAPSTVWSGVAVMEKFPELWAWYLRLPFLACGVFLGAS